MNQRIETSEARQLRSQRQGFAAPGGSHDRLVGFLARVLPMAVGVLAAFMVITPLSPRGEVSFLLDRNKVAMIDERLRVDNAMYRGKNDKGQPFSVTASEAVQRSGVEGIVRMRDLVARIVLPEGPARIGAEAGTYTIDKDLVAVPSEIRLTAADGYWMTARGGEAASGNVAVYDFGRRIITMVGDVRLRRGGDTLNGGRLVIDLKTGVSSVDGSASGSSSVTGATGTTRSNGRVTGSFSVPQN